MAPCIGLSIKKVWITVSGSNNWAVKSFCAFRGAGFLGIHCEQESSRISKNFNITQNSLLRKILAKDIVVNPLISLQSIIIFGSPAFISLF